MDKIRDAIVTVLKGKFPYMADSIIPYTGLLDEQSEEQISYTAPGILVCILPFGEAPIDIAPWELMGEFGLVIPVKGVSAKERDALGWQLCMEVAAVTYRNTWGITRMNVCPAIITGIQKNEQRDKTGTPTGVNYWTIQFNQFLKFEALL